MTIAGPSHQTGTLQRTLGLRETLERFLAFRREVLTRRFTFELRKAEERAHILEGLRIAIAYEASNPWKIGIS